MVDVGPPGARPVRRQYGGILVQHLGDPAMSPLHCVPTAVNIINCVESRYHERSSALLHLAAQELISGDSLRAGEAFARTPHQH